MFGSERALAVADQLHGGFLVGLEVLAVPLEPAPQDVQLARRGHPRQRPAEGEGDPLLGAGASLFERELGQLPGGLDVGDVVQELEGLERRIGSRPA